MIGRDRLRIGAIGAGYWGPNLIRNFIEIAGSEVVAVADLNPGRLDHISTRYPQIGLVTDDYRDMFDLDLDGVVISTPPQTHFEIARDCIKAGVDVLIEKPLATSSEQAGATLAIAAEYDRVVMVGHTFLYNEAVNVLKGMITAGELGDLRYIDSVRVGLGQFHPTLNVVWDLGPHDISILMHLLGSVPETVSARGVGCVQDGVEDIVYMSLTFPGDVLAHIRLSWLDPSKTRRVTAVGSKKMVIYDDVESEKIRVYDKGVEVIPHTDTYGDFQFNYRYGDIVSPYIRFDEPLRVECAHFLDCIRTRGDPISNGLSGLRVVEVIEAAQRSLAAGGRVEPVEISERVPTHAVVGHAAADAPDVNATHVDGTPTQGDGGVPTEEASYDGHPATRGGPGLIIDLGDSDARVSSNGWIRPRRVPFVDPDRDTYLTDDEFDATGNPADLEAHVARYCGAAHVVTVPPGHFGLEVALTASGIGPGDEVITAATAPRATIAAIEAAGATPILVDVHAGTFTLQADAIGPAATPYTRAIVPVHLHGQPADMEAIGEVGRRHGLAVFEDASQALGARVGDKRVGTMGRAGIIGFDMGANALGDGGGGLIVTNDDSLADSIRGAVHRLSAGPPPDGTNGFRHRLDTIYAAVVDSSWPLHDLEIRRRRGVASLYSELLADLPVRTPPDVPAAQSVYHSYVIQSPDRDALRRHLSKLGVPTAIHNRVPIHLRRAYRRLGYGEGDLPVTENAARRVISLPMRATLSAADISHVAHSIRSFFGR